MAVSTKYGKIYIEGIGDNEPVFIIRAQDAIGVPAIEDYLDRAWEAMSPNTLLDGIEDEIEAFEVWRRNNETKLPD